MNCKYNIMVFYFHLSTLFIIMLDLIEIIVNSTHSLAEFGDKCLRFCAVNILVFCKTYFVGNSDASSHPTIYHSMSSLNKE